MPAAQAAGLRLGDASLPRSAHPRRPVRRARGTHGELPPRIAMSRWTAAEFAQYGGPGRDSALHLAEGVRSTGPLASRSSTSAMSAAARSTVAHSSSGMRPVRRRSGRVCSTSRGRHRRYWRTHEPVGHRPVHPDRHGRGLRPLVGRPRPGTARLLSACWRPGASGRRAPRRCRGTCDPAGVAAEVVALPPILQSEPGEAKWIEPGPATQVIQHAD